MKSHLHPSAKLLFSLALLIGVYGCATTQSMRPISTHDLQDRFLVTLLESDGVTDLESELFPERLRDSRPAGSIDEMIEAMVLGLSDELREASVVGETRALREAYADRIDAFHTLIFEVVSVDGKFSDAEVMALERYIKDVAPTIDAKNASKLPERIRQVTREGARPTGAEKLSARFWEKAKLDLLLVEGLNQGEYERLLSANLISEDGTKTHLGLNASEYSGLIGDPAKAEAFRMSDEALRGYARYLKPSRMRNPLYLYTFEYLNMDEPFVSEAEFQRYNFIAKTVSDEAKRLVDAGALNANSAIMLQGLVRDARLMTKPDPSARLELKSLSQFDITMLFILDVARADGLSERMLKHYMSMDYRQAFLRASGFLDQQGSSWNQSSRRDLFVYVLGSLRDRLNRIGRQPSKVGPSMVRYWDEIVGENGVFSKAEETVMAGYFGGFASDGPGRQALLETCQEATWREKNPDKVETCSELLTLVADGIHEHFQKFTLPEHRESNRYAAVARQMHSRLIQDVQEPSRREIVYNLKGIMKAQRAYEARYNAAKAFGGVDSEVDVDGDAMNVSFKDFALPFERAAFTADERWNFFLANQDTLAVPARHRFRAVFTKSRGYRSYLRKSDEQAQADIVAIVDAAKKGIEGFELEAERIFGEAIFKEDEYGFAHGRFAMDTTDEGLASNFWEKGLENYHLEAADIERLKTLKPGQVSGVLVGTLPYTSEKIYLAVQYIAYEPPTTGWDALRHSDVLNRAMWDDAARLEALKERDVLLQHPYPLSADQFPKRKDGYSLKVWNSFDPASGNFARLQWHPRAFVDKGKGIAASYWVEDETSANGGDPRFVIYGKATLPGNLPDLMYSFASDQAEPVLVEGNAAP